MEKTEMIRARVNPKLKKQAEAVLEELGLSASVAINMFYRQIVLRKGLPFRVTVPNAVTERTFEDTDAGKNLISAENADDLFEKLGMSKK
jgi:DNA-damage-inducible protein J